MGGRWAGGQEQLRSQGACDARGTRRSPGPASWVGTLAVCVTEDAGSVAWVEGRVQSGLEDCGGGD